MSLVNLETAKETASSFDSQNGSALSNLWHSAYSEASAHPVATAAIAAGALVAAGAALYATRGRIGALFQTAKPDVLLIEDTPGMAKALRYALQEEGHEVTWVAGVKQLEPLTGITPEGAEIPMAEGHWNVALVDGDLGKESLTGPQIVGTLKDNHIMSVGTSTVESFNDEMLANGADAAANKSVVFGSILDHKLDLATALRMPGSAQRALNSFKASLLSPESKELRQRADALLMKYMTE
ncbi:MAG TPA: hypothetical protein V6C72_12830 [Chroococcales cyanobacterium]